MRPFFLIPILAAGFANCSSAEPIGGDGTLTGIENPYPGVPPRTLQVALSSRAWLSDLANKASSGDMSARLRFAGLLDLGLAPKPICDQMARERADLVRKRQFKSSYAAGVALSQLGELRQSAFARRALIEIVADWSSPQNLRYWALANHMAHLRAAPEAPGRFARERVATRRELAVYWNLATSSRGTDREAALMAISLGGVDELRPLLVTRVRSLTNRQMRLELYACIATLRHPTNQPALPNMPNSRRKAVTAAGPGYQGKKR